MTRAIPLLMLGALVLTAGCATTPILMKHPDGRTTQCGPYTNMHPLFPGMSPHWKAERECISDYQRQGFERAPVVPGKE